MIHMYRENTYTQKNIYQKKMEESLALKGGREQEPGGKQGREKEGIILF